ncbi:transcriptional regulator [Massilia sp. KIM]|uniref:helix-turn-helix transcriptional regulator n=1 Tax=Massilia sp. KIM TaxID=1955422 RepID=UPI00098ECEF5|nr:helix-turn-helix transcriptional regulator [Massilia sp. KIM]OON62468.1 transcriptional regulator [Massilia sp. KIM]
MTDNSIEQSALRSPVCVALGQNLKKLRIAAAKSQEELAVDAEVDRTYISSIERGAANPSVLTLAQICFALGVSLADLVTPVIISTKPSDLTRRANAAKPSPRVRKSRLR